MKKLIYISVTLLIATNAIAQNRQFNPVTKHQALNPFLKSIIQQQANTNLAEKPTGLKERVVASSGYFISPDSVLYPDTIVKADTAIYKYSGSRGSQFDYYDIRLSLYDYYNNGYSIATPFDTAGLLFNISPMANNSALDHSNQQLVECDTFRQWQLFPSRPTDSTIVYAKYDANNNLINYFYSSLLVPQYSYYNKYNPNNSVAYNNKYHNMADTDYKRYFIYNSANQLIEDSTVEYYHDSTAIKDNWEYTYQYDSFGRLNNIVSNYRFSPSVKRVLKNYTLAYYSDNKLKTFVDSLGEYDSLSYTPGFNYPTGVYIYSFDSTAKVIDLEILLHLNKNNLPDTILNIFWRAIDTNSISITYDSLNNPIISDNSQYAYGGVLSYRTYFYYETYTATQIPNISQNTDNIKVYPNPATNQIYINLADATKNAQVFVNLINTNGQLIRTESVPPNSQVWQTSIAELTPGTYFISICDRAGNKLHSQTIIKQ